MSKQEQRLEIKSKLKLISDIDKKIKSEIICDKIIDSGLLCNADKILVYMSLPNEVDLQKLISYCSSKSKSLFLPRVNGEYLEIVPLSNNFLIGAFGIQEPIGQAVRDNMDVAILPALAVDRKKNRLGKGKGFYDRYLAEGRVKITVAVAFAEQVLENVETQPHDQPVDFIFFD